MVRERSSITIYDPRGYGSGTFADQVHEIDKPSVSRLLGPDGRPLPYPAKPRIGFDLSPRKDKPDGR